MDFVANFLQHLASVSIRALGLAGLAFASIALLRLRSAAARHAIWTVVVAAMLAIAIAEPLLPSLPLPILHAPADSAISTPLAPVTQPLLIQPVAPTPATPSNTWRPSGRQAVAALYLAVLVAMVTRLAFGYLFTRRLVRASRPIDRPWAAGVYESNWISVPMTVGWIHPRILLPAPWEQWENEKLQAVLAHERTHVRRADWAIAVMAGLNRCLFWFHPLAWWLERRLALLAEQACDDAALLLVDTAPYARALLDMAAAVKTGQGRLIWEAMAMANVAEVRRRIERILDETRQIPKGLTRSGWAALIAASLPVVYIVSVLQLAPARAQQSVVTPPAIEELLKGRKQLTPADVSTMEQYVAANPHDLDVRTQLILYYFANGTREPRLRHIFWLIANHPEATQAAFASRGITARTTSFNDSADFARALELWKQQAASHSTDLRVLANTAEFLSQPGGDPAEAERLLLSARGMQPMANLMWAEKLGKLYAAAILGESGDPRFPSLSSGFAARVKQQLEDSTDQWVLHFAGMALANVALRPELGKTLAPGVLNLNDHAALLPSVDFGTRLMTKSEELGVPKGLGHSEVGSPAAFSTTPKTVGPPAPVPANPTLASAPPLLNRVEPEYPPLARIARIQGTVKLLATIGTDGRVTNIQIISAPAALVQAAMDAVQKWVYAPIAKAGTLEVNVPFTLPPSDTPPRPAQEAPNAAPRSTPSTAPPMLTSAPPLIKRVEPVYSPLAMQARIQGIVRLMATIETDGHVSHIEVISGHPLLVPPSMESVKQWLYSPIPAAGTIEIQVPFTLPGGTPPPAMGPQAANTPRKGSARVAIGAAVQAAKLVSKVDAVYPPQAKAAGIEGSVTLDVVIGEDGHVQSVEPMGGHPLLAAAAAEAVRQWVYQPTTLSDMPVQVHTTVTITFP